jgi:hypothetical protein
MPEVGLDYSEKFERKKQLTHHEKEDAAFVPARFQSALQRKRKLVQSGVLELLKTLHLYRCQALIIT